MSETSYAASQHLTRCYTAFLYGQIREMAKSPNLTSRCLNATGSVIADAPSKSGYFRSRFCIHTDVGLGLAGFGTFRQTGLPATLCAYELLKAQTSMGALKKEEEHRRGREIGRCNMRLSWQSTYVSKPTALRHAVC